MVFLSKGRVSERFRTRVSIGIVTNPWNPASNSPEQARQTPRPPAGSRPQHPDSVSGTLRISDMVTPRKIPPGSGWRKFIYSVSFKASISASHRLSGITANCGTDPPPHPQAVRVGFVSGKGGVGKTTMTACIGAMFRECRPENVVAIDAAPGFGTLAGRIDESPPGDYSAVFNDTDVQGYADIREHLGQNRSGSTCWPETGRRINHGHWCRRCSPGCCRGCAEPTT